MLKCRDGSPRETTIPEEPLSFKAFLRNVTAVIVDKIKNEERKSTHRLFLFHSPQET
jgi:hypothetical protein